MKKLIYLRHPNPLREPDFASLYIESRANLTLNKEYQICKTQPYRGYYYVFTDNGTFLGMFPESCFLTLKQLRNKKLKELR